MYHDRRCLRVPSHSHATLPLSRNHLSGTSIVDCTALLHHILLARTPRRRRIILRLLIVLFVLVVLFSVLFSPFVSPFSPPLRLRP